MSIWARFEVRGAWQYHFAFDGTAEIFVSLCDDFESMRMVSETILSRVSDHMQYIFNAVYLSM